MRYYLFLALLLASGSALGAQEAAPLLTLREAVLVALANNDRMLNSRESIEQARLGRTLAESAFGTRITPNLLGSFGQSDVRNQTYGVGTSKRFTTGTEVRMDVGASTFRNQIGSFYAADTTLVVSQSLLRGFRAGRWGGGRSTGPTIRSRARSASTSLRNSNSPSRSQVPISD